jgi:hypothetical protein
MQWKRDALVGAAVGAATMAAFAAMHGSIPGELDTVGRLVVAAALTMVPGLIVGRILGVVFSAVLGSPREWAIWTIFLVSNAAIYASAWVLFRRRHRVVVSILWVLYFGVALLIAFAEGIVGFD